MNESVEWHLPNFVALEKHVKFYRDLLRSTERVELVVAHAGKAEVFAQSEASDCETFDRLRYPTVLVTAKEDLDPRLPYRSESDGRVSVSPDFKDWKLIQRRMDIANPPSSNLDPMAAVTLAKRNQLMQTQYKRDDSPKRRKRSSGWD